MPNFPSILSPLWHDTLDLSTLYLVLTTTYIHNQPPAPSTQGNGERKRVGSSPLEDPPKALATVSCALCNIGFFRSSSSPFPSPDSLPDGISESRRAGACVSPSGLLASHIHTYIYMFSSKRKGNTRLERSHQSLGHTAGGLASSVLVGVCGHSGGYGV